MQIEWHCLLFHVKTIVRNSHSIQLVYLKKEHFGVMKTLKDEWYAIKKVYHSWEIFLHCVSVLCPFTHFLMRNSATSVCPFLQASNRAVLLVSCLWLTSAPNFLMASSTSSFDPFRLALRRNSFGSSGRPSSVCITKYFQRMSILFFHNQS